jgi:hypothetical protein
MTCRNFHLLRILGSTLRLTVEADLSSRGQKDFICREEKRKAAWGHAVGPGNWWFHGSGWKLGFIAFFLYCPKMEISLRCKQTFSGKEKCLLGSLPFKSPLSMIALTAIRDRDNEVYSVITYC